MLFYIAAYLYPLAIPRFAQRFRMNVIAVGKYWLVCYTDNAADT